MAELVALIPAYNESARIASVVTGARARLPVLVVDDGSADDTATHAKEAGATVLRQVPNQGKGAALRAGFRYALEEGFGAVLTLDADGQHDPAEIPKFLQAYAEHRADLIIGARDFGQIPLVRRLANTLGRWSFSWALGQPVCDNQSGYRLISQRLMEATLTSQESGFEFEVEMIVTCIQRGYALEWVPIRTIYGTEKSHINPLYHVMSFLRVVWQTRQRVRQGGRKSSNGSL
jgi:glycosyltransferase involved in cell wall biosynthesis